VSCEALCSRDIVSKRFVVRRNFKTYDARKEGWSFRALPLLLVSPYHLILAMLANQQSPNALCCQFYHATKGDVIFISIFIPSLCQDSAAFQRCSSASERERFRGALLIAC
jgi:hypothetical protein